MVLSTLINAPLLNRANPDVTPNPSKAPWYFLNLQELLLHMDKAWAGVLLPTIALVFFIVIPYIDRSREGQGVWFGTKYAARLTIITVIYATIVSVSLVIFDAGDRSVTPHPLPEAEAQMVTKWIPSCDPADAHPTTPCLTDAEGEEHQGLLSVKDISKRLRVRRSLPRYLGHRVTATWTGPTTSTIYPCPSMTSATEYRQFPLMVRHAPEHPGHHV